MVILGKWVGFSLLYMFSGGLGGKNQAGENQKLWTKSGKKSGVHPQL